MAEKVCLHFEFIYFAVVKYLDKKITLKTKGGRLFLLVGWLVFFKFTIHTAGKSQRQELETASHVASKVKRQGKQMHPCSVPCGSLNSCISSGPSLGNGATQSGLGLPIVN